ncbi:hypothetical protein Tsubulata_029926, partial [Turnera subulata]
MSFSRYHIDVEVKDLGEGAWRLTGFYGDPMESDRGRSWDLLRMLKNRSALPWMVFGDYNEILVAKEKHGRLPKPDRLMRAFRDAVEFCELRDLGYSGNSFTWDNGRDGVHNAQLRLDRAMGSCQWQNLFPRWGVTHLGYDGSDHRPIKLSLVADTAVSVERLIGCYVGFVSLGGGLAGGRPLLLVVRFGSVASRGGRALSGCESWLLMVDAVEETLCKLSRWSSNTHGNIPKEIKAVRLELERLSSMWPSLDICQCKRLLERKLDDLLEREELLWRQQAIWLESGDRNTTYFHRKANQRRKKNMLVELEDDDGVTVIEKGALLTLVFQYFSDIFSSSLASPISTDLSILASKVSGAMVDDLSAPFTAEEVQRALFQMKPSKAPSPDGMPPRFFQKF